MIWGFHVRNSFKWILRNVVGVSYIHHIPFIIGFYTSSSWDLIIYNSTFLPGQNILIHRTTLVDRLLAFKHRITMTLALLYHRLRIIICNYVLYLKKLNQWSQYLTLKYTHAFYWLTRIYFSIYADWLKKVKISLTGQLKHISWYFYCRPLHIWNSLNIHGKHRQPRTVMFNRTLTLWDLTFP